MRVVLAQGWERCRALPGLVQDAGLYLVAACFAAGMALMPTVRSSDYRAWGQIAAVAYAIGGICCVAAAVRDHRRPLAPSSVGWIRRAVLAGLFLGAVVAPLGAELTWRAEAKPGVHAQPEVAVIERAGDRAAHGEDPYPAHPRSVGVAPSGDQPGVDATSFFPYLPGMVSFGILNALHVPPELQDARFELAVFTLAVAAIALTASGVSLSRQGRVLQFLVVLPFGALPMVTGGDDLPVLALMLLGVVLAQRRSPVAAGIALGLAGSLKFTAWPLLFLLAFAIRDRRERAAWGRYGIAVGAVLTPVVALGLALQPSSFIENVIRFPLGLAKIKSPAASPLLGQFFVSELPNHKTVITAALLALGAAIAVAALVRYPPRTPAAAVNATAFVMVLATVLAPATRFGYLIYPANLVVWAYVLPKVRVPERAWRRSRARLSLEGAAARALDVAQSAFSVGGTSALAAQPPLDSLAGAQSLAGGQSPSSSSMTSMATVLPPPELPPPELAETEPPEGSTNTPTSQ